ncbi:MAG: sugar phosphate isomerase/epimerase [candidate division Zixibacteria bacterium]|nr:sugar phosphate isomerase/epimerase [candidate division Zixibacteria bacterium]
MKIALQEGLLPGESMSEKLDFAESLNIEGLEVSGWSKPYERVTELESALRGRKIKVASVCGQTTFDFLDPDPGKRKASIEESKRNLEVSAHFGAAGQIVPPIFGPPRIPDLLPYADAITLEKRLLAEIVKDLAAYAHARNTLLLLEPLNRYEQHLLRRQDDGVEAIRMAGDPAGVKLLSDFFHMHIEETDTPAAFRRAGRYVGHIHMADNTRQEPGTGDIDWKAGLGALKEIGFTGYLAYECGITGQTPDEKRAAIRRSVTYIREVIAGL